MFGSIFSLVVEADLPYRDEQIAQYGESFKTWTEEEFSNMIGSLTAALALGSSAMIVSFLRLIFFRRCIIRISKRSL